MVRNARFHGWRNPQRLVDSPEVVVHEMQRNRVNMILDFLREAIPQASETTHAHAHRQILALYVARGDALHVRIALDHDALFADDLGRALAALAFRCRAKDLNRLRIIDLRSERAFDGVDIDLKAIRSDLHAVGQA